MKLTLKNIGKIEAASVEINGITVIAGENNTGKSTVGKALYCLFRAFHDINDRIDQERSWSVYRTISGSFRKKDTSIDFFNLKKIAEEICKDRIKYIENTDELRNRLTEIYESFASHDIAVESVDEEGIDTIFHKILSYLKLEDNTIKL